jgi:hypothetical protein
MVASAGDEALGGHVRAKLILARMIPIESGLSGMGEVAVEGASPWIRCCARWVLTARRGGARWVKPLRRYTCVTTELELRLIQWDEAKNRSNQLKHGVSFEAAALVFEDPLHVSRQERIERGESRWQTIGMVGDGVLLLVAHTWREDDHGEEHIRIVSARRATKLERRIYEKGA